MNRFIHRIVSSQGVVSREEFHRQMLRKRLIWFGEFHSEPRISSFQNDLVVALAGKAGTAAATTAKSSKKLHIVMEHFSVEMQSLLDQFQTDPAFGFNELKEAYQEVGTEGHGLDPYKGFLMYCKNGATTTTTSGGTEEAEKVPLQDEIFQQIKVNNGGDGNAGGMIKLHGGFIPRPHASRWNKAESIQEKHELLEEYYQKDFLPPPSNPMHQALWADRDQLLLNGSTGHFRLIKSMMSGEDLYSPQINENDEEEEDDGNEEQKDEDNDNNAKGPDGAVAMTPIEKLYQAQLLKDHAMGYHLGKLMMEHQNDRFLVIAGLGHLKHRLGVPECLENYLKAQTLYGNGEGAHSQESAMNALVSSTKFSALTGCQMLYETYLEDLYEPLQIAVTSDEEVDDEDEEDEDDKEDDYRGKNSKQVLNDLFLNKPELFNKLVLGSEIMQQRMFRYDEGSGNFLHPSFDYCFVYDEDDENLLEPGMLSTKPVTGTGVAGTCPNVKAETQEAYNSVGETAGKKGNLLKAKAVMKYLNYTDEDMALIGDEVLYNFQGVANPHREAKLQPGEDVLDLGSGLGLDSFLAAERVMKKCDDVVEGTVTGVDLAPKQVAHANAVAKTRKNLVDNNIVRFVQGDAENLSATLSKLRSPPAPKFDVCISNGAFCLIPNKELAFKQVYDALKPGGRMAVSTTTTRQPEGLDKKLEWPVCMEMFANLSDIQPMCERVGFENVRVVDADSPMEMEFSEDVFFTENDTNPERFKIHGKRYADQYDYLEKMDMDQLCKVVTVCATKPKHI